MHCRILYVFFLTILSVIHDFKPRHFENAPSESPMRKVLRAVSGGKDKDKSLLDDEDEELLEKEDMEKEDQEKMVTADSTEAPAAEKAVWKRKIQKTQLCFIGE